MRKVKLNADELRVETFAIGGSQSRTGTVRGNMPFKIPASDDAACGGGGGTETCGCPTDYTCPHTCAQTCGIDYCSELTNCATPPYCCP